MRSLLTARVMSGTASISWARSGCDVRVIEGADAGVGDDAGGGKLRDSGAMLLVRAAETEGSSSSTVPVAGGECGAGCVPSASSFDQAILGSRG